MSYLALVRHSESEWNAKGLWTGWTDIDLGEAGRVEARKTAELIKDIKFDAVFCSPLARCRQTLDELRTVIDLENVQTEFVDALKERNYGDFTGKNKWEIEKQVGEEEFIKIRRAWDYPLSNGESLKDVYERAMPYYKKSIEPIVKSGKNVLVVAHGNSIRALLKYLENIPDEQISSVEVGIAQAVILELDSAGKVIKKEVRGGVKDAPHEKQ